MKVSGSAAGGTDPNAQETRNSEQPPMGTTPTTGSQVPSSDSQISTTSSQQTDSLPAISEDQNQSTYDIFDEPPSYESAVSSGYLENTANDASNSESTEKVESGEPEFPVRDLQKLDESLNKTKWVVPVTPGAELEILLDAAIDLCKRGLDTKSEPCQRFFREGLQSSFAKLMMDDAVIQWKPEIHQYIYDSSLKVIQLCVTKLADDWFCLLELLAVVLNANNRFHQVNHKELAKTLPQDGCKLLKTYAEPHEQYNKGWLVDFVNTFGNLDGFEALYNRVVKGSNLTVPIMAALLKPFAVCTQVLSVTCAEQYLMPCCDSVLEVLKNLTDEDLKKETKSESKSDNLTSVVKSLKVLYQHVPERRCMLEEIESFRLKMILRLLQISSFSGKMNALNEVNRLVQSVYSYSGRSVYDDEETGVTSDRLAEWIQDNKVLSIVLKDNLHQPQYVERLEKILWFMIRQKALTKDDLDTLWAAQVDKHEAIVKNIHDLLARLAWNFSAEQLDYLFQCFQKSWTHAGKRQREKLLELIRRLAEDDKEGVMAVKVLGLLWNLAHSEDCPKEIMEQALAAHIKILDYSCAVDRDQQKTQWLLRCIEELKTDVWVLPAIKMIHDIFSMYFEGPSNMSVQTHHNFCYRQEVISHFERKYHLIDLVTQNLGLYIEKARKYTEANPSTEPAELMIDGHVSHEQQVTERLNFLRFILKDGQLYLSLAPAKTIWHWLAEKAVFGCDREAAFKWFSKVMGEDPDLEPEVGRPFFEEHVLQIDPADVTESGMKCFERAFTMVNQREQKLTPKRHHRVTNDLSLVGLDYLWKLFLHGSDDIAIRAIDIVKNIYTNLGPPLEPKQVAIHRKFIQTCFDYLRESYSELSGLKQELDAEDQSIATVHTTRMVRCLKLLREYIAECDAAHEDERAILPHGKSWLGRHTTWTIRFPMPNGRPEDIELTTHGNESLAAVRRKIIRMRRGSSQSSRLDLYINGELVNPMDDKKLIHQLPFRDKQLVTAKLSHIRHAVSPSQDSSSDSSTNSVSHLFEGPNVEVEQSLPGVVISRDPSYCAFLLNIGQLGIHFNVPSLRDNVRQLLELIPTDQGAMLNIRQCSSEMTKDGMAQLKKLCFEMPPLNTLYYLEVVHSMLMPASSFEEEQSQQFQVWFFENGGIFLLLSLLKEPNFMRDADNTTRRSSYSVCIKLAKVMLCSMGFAKLTTWSRCLQRGERLSSVEQNDQQRISHALHQLPGLQTDLLIWSIATRLGQMASEASVNALELPSLETIHSVKRLAWASSAGVIHLVHATPEDIHAAFDRSPGTTGRAVEPECSAIAKEALEVLSVCLTLLPSAHENLTRDSNWKLFISDMLLMARTRSVRVAACEQFYLMITRCSGDSRPLSYFTVLLFAGLETDVVKRAKMSSEYFTLLCHLLSHISSTREIQLDIEHKLNLQIQWLKSVKMKFGASGGPVVEDSLLEGHLNVMKELLAFKTSTEKHKIGSSEGQGLIKELVEDFLCPASRMLLQVKRSRGSLPSEPVKPICSVVQTQNAAYDLLVAFVTDCVPNLEELCRLQEELFYQDNAIPLLEWEFAPPVGPRPMKGFVGLKNAGATCYMNSVVQMLYMIPEIRNYILKVQDLWKETEEEEETSFVEEKNLKNQYLNERAENEQEPKPVDKLTPAPGCENQEEDRNSYRVTVVKQIQCIFGHLMKSRLQYYTPRGLWKSFRMQDRPVNVREQQDAMEFFNGIVDGVDEGLKTMEHEQIVVKVMGGVFADQKICKGCPHRYAKEEPFMSISVDIRHHQHLLESLEQYVKGDLLEGDNAYFCEKCQKKVDTIKRTCIQKLPPVLVIQLKRFDYDWERDCAVKFNDYIEFPRELDMEPYTVQGLAKLEGERVEVEGDPDKDKEEREDGPFVNACTRYRLAGIVVHSGQASGGHYYSYIAQRVDGQGTKWFKFEDGEVGEARMEDDEELKSQCFGGEFMGETYDHVMKRMQYRRQKRWWNAYLLFYEREDVPYTVVGTDGPPAPVLPGAIERAVQRENLEYSHTKAQFGLDYFRFMRNLAQANLPFISEERPDISEQQEHSVMLSVKLLTKFLFSVGFRTKKVIRGSALEWSNILLTLLRCNKTVRFWFATAALFEHTERFSEYLLECPSQEVRSAFSKLIAYLAHYSLNDGPYKRPLPSYDVATCSPKIEAPPPASETQTLSDCLLDAVLSLMKKEVGEHDRHLQQYFQLFLTYANQGTAERTQLLWMRVPSLFISVSLGDGPASLGYRQHSPDFSKLHGVISLLVRCCDITKRVKSSCSKSKVLRNPFSEIPELVPIDTDLEQAIFDNHRYVKKVIVENTASEDTIRLIRYCSWENPVFSRMVLSELLSQLTYVYTYELKPFLDLLLHVLLIEDSWQHPRIVNTIAGFHDQPGADGLVDIIQRARNHYQKRAYQCIKMMVVLFNSCSLANDLLHKDPTLKRQWHNAVMWLAEELERRPYSHTYGYNNWSPPAQSNETSNGYFLERSNSAKQTLTRACDLCPVEEQPDETETMMDESPQEQDSPISQSGSQYNNDTANESPNVQHRRPKSPVSPNEVRVTQSGPSTRVELRKKTKSVDNLDQIEDFVTDQNLQDSSSLQPMDED